MQLSSTALHSLSSAPSRDDVLSTTHYNELSRFHFLPCDSTDVERLTCIQQYIKPKRGGTSSSDHHSFVCNNDKWFSAWKVANYFDRFFG